jgi:hypothetical protein
MNLKPDFWRSCCPVCNSENQAYIYDQGLKFWRRLVVGNNRFACKNCKVTWRRKSPDRLTRLQKRGGSTSPTRSISRPQRIYINFKSEFKRKFKVYCIIGLISAVFAYAMIAVFPLIFQELAPKHGTEIPNTDKKNSAVPNLRNDKMSGKQELVRLRNGKKN